MAKDVKIHPIDFHDDDWQTVCDLATKLNTTPNNLVRLAVKQMAIIRGHKWRGVREYKRKSENT